jgi:hypothetical protein
MVKRAVLGLLATLCVSSPADRVNALSLVRAKPSGPADTGEAGFI